MPRPPPPPGAPPTVVPTGASPPLDIQVAPVLGALASWAVALWRRESLFAAPPPLPHPCSEPPLPAFLPP